MIAVFTTNNLDHAVGQAIERSRGCRWAGIYRDGAVFVVHDAPLPRQVAIATARDGRLEPLVGLGSMTLSPADRELWILGRRLALADSIRKDLDDIGDDVERQAASVAWMTLVEQTLVLRASTGQGLRLKVNILVTLCELFGVAGPVADAALSLKLDLDLPVWR